MGCAESDAMAPPQHPSVLREDTNKNPYPKPGDMPQRAGPGGKRQYFPPAPPAMPEAPAPKKREEPQGA